MTKENLEQKSKINFVKVAIIATLALAVGLIPLIKGIGVATNFYRNYCQMQSDLKELKEHDGQRRKDQEALERFEKFKNYLLNPPQEHEEQRKYNDKLKHC